MPDDSPSSLFVRHRTLLLIGLGLLVYVSFLGLRDLWYPDEPDIAEVCKAMFTSGDWISPRRMGLIWVDYPPMIYWAGTISSHLLGGMSAFALRLPNALAAIGVVLLTGAAASRWFNPRTGLWAGFLLLTFVQFGLQAVGYRPDMLFTLTIAGGLLVYARGAEERSSWLLRAAGFVLFGLAMLAKGPLGLLLPGLVLVLWHGTRREWVRILQLAPLSGLALAVYVPWFVACANAMGADNILHELYAQNFQRFASGSRGHERPIYYYLANFWIDFAPWSWIAPFALYWIHRARLWRDRNVQLALWWFVAFIVFLSFAATKRQLYLLPAYPALALLIAPWFADVGRRREPGRDRPDPLPMRIYLAATAVGFVFLAAVLFVVAASIDTIIDRAEMHEAEIAVARAMGFPLMAVGVVLLLSGLLIGHAWWSGRLRAGLGRAAAAYIVLYIVMLAWVLPPFDAYKSYEPQSFWIRERIGSETRIGMVDPAYAGRKMGAFGYYTEALVVRMESRDEVERFFSEHPGSVVLVHDGSAGLVFDDEEAAWRPRILRDLRTGSRVYHVLRGPDPAAQREAAGAR